MSRESHSRALAAQRKKREAEAAEAQRQADLARTGELRTRTKGRNAQRRTIYQRWNGTEWERIDKAQYDKEKKEKTALVREPSTDAEIKPEPAPPAIPVPIPTQKAPEGFQQLRYPRESIEKGQDFIKFDIREYRRDRNLVTRSDDNIADLNAKPIGTILLPIPSQISDSNIANYGPSGLNFLQEGGLGTAQSLIGGKVGEGLNRAQETIMGVAGNSELVKNFFAIQAVNAFGGNLTLDQILARSQGQIINPNQELLFSGPGLRQFKFSFKFTPRGRTESGDVKKIIKAFKRNMAPKGSGGAFLGTPNVFQITYMEGNQEHSFLHKFKLCVLTNMSVNYTADGVHATYYDGTPVSMQMDLSFNELTPIYNEDYNEIESFGAGNRGVGF